MAFEFAIRAWSAYADGLDSRARWLEWAAGPVLPTGDSPPALAELAPAARRRLGTLGRMAVQVGYWCQESAGAMPVVLASRYGEAARSLELMHELAGGNPLSPTAFGLSVHNGIGAQYSIARGDRGSYLSVAGGAESAAAGVMEAVALLADGADSVLVVCYDAPLPGPYAAYADEPGCHYAWAWVLERPGRTGCEWFSLEAVEAQHDEDGRAWPFGLDVLRFVLSGDVSMRRAAGGQVWQWLRHA